MYYYFQTPDEQLQIYVCDLFSVNKQKLGTFDAVWDKGSFVAILPSNRPK